MPIPSFRHCGPAIAVASMALAMAVAARADPRLDETVYSPVVEGRVLEFELRTARLTGGSQRSTPATVAEVGYGLDDRFSVALVATHETGTDGRGRLTDVGIEGITRLGRIPGAGIDTGLYLEYRSGRNGEPDVGEAKLLLAKTQGRFEGLVNLIAERPFGAPRGEGYASYGYAVSALWQTTDQLRLGVEAFGDLGDDHGLLSRRQGAYAGPRLKWEIQPRGLPVSIAIDAAWLAALGPAHAEGRSETRLGVELERRF